MSKRITVALIERTESVVELQAIWTELAEKAWEMATFTRNFQALCESNTTFHSIQNRWELVNDKLAKMGADRGKGNTPYRQVSFGDLLC